MEKKIMVAGAGISGLNACRLLLQVKKQVLLYDGNTACDTAAIREALGDLGDPEILLGELTEEALAEVEYCVISPGISMDAPLVQVLRAGGIPILSEVELAYRYSRGRLAAITGTNGKTTTTALLGKIVADAGNRTFVVGNIGRAYTADALNSDDESVTVAEISSFQLETVRDFHPQVSAILNITPDHLNRHKTMECYTRVKGLIAKNQTPEDVCVLNYEDERLREMGAGMVPRALFFSSRRSLERGAWLEGDRILFNLEGETCEVCNIHELKLLGRHNYENVMAAVLMALSLGIDPDSVRKSVTEFVAVEHRIEFVVEKDGVKYYNDSKGTNPDAAIQAINAMVSPTVLIAGGYDKGGEFDDWIKACKPRTRHLILIGATAKRIGATAEKYGLSPVSYADTFEEAVELAKSAAEPGDAVLLSPACASWGMFRNYEERGRIFKELVRG